MTSGDQQLDQKDDVPVIWFCVPYIDTIYSGGEDSFTKEMRHTFKQIPYLKETNPVHNEYLLVILIHT